MLDAVAEAVFACWEIVLTSKYDDFSDGKAGSAPEELLTDIGAVSSWMETISGAENQHKSESASDIKAEPAIAKSQTKKTKVQKPAADDLTGDLVATLALAYVNVPKNSDGCD